MKTHPISRRKFIKGAGLGAALLLAGNRTVQAGALQAGALETFGAFAGSAPAPPSELFVPDAEIALTAHEKQVQILPGAKTRVWSYSGQLVKGSGVTVQEVAGSYLGPILRVESGKKVRIVFHNDLPEKTVLHPHGLRVPENCDGHPMRAIEQGQELVYEFPVIDRAGPYWFHPHPHMRTAYQVAMGLAGLFYVTDPAEELAVPGAGTGANDVPVVIQDRSFDSNNQFLYQPNMMWGYLGERILVNGKVDAALALEPRAYRLRLLNGSNARTYKLAWSNNMPVSVIGTDGGLLAAPVAKRYVTLMPGERIDIWADFSRLAGQQVVLRSLAFQPGGMMGGMGMGSNGKGGMAMGSMMGGMMGGMGMTLPNGAAFNVLVVNVGRKASANPEPGPFPAFPLRYDANNVPNFASPRPFVLGMQHMIWSINGRVYEESQTAADEIIRRGEVIAWEWVNNSPIPHPMHVHNGQFQVVRRAVSANTSSYASVNQGFVDSGWKDTVTVWPGERVRIAMALGPNTGMYMYHCHILEHEDMGMMRNLMIEDPAMPGM